MKKVLFLTVCMFIISVGAYAQQRGGTPEENAKRQTEWMTTALKLNAQQVKQVEAINLSTAKDRAALMEKAGGNFSSVRDDMTKLTTKTEEQLSKVLTKDQMDEYKKQMAERRGNRGAR